MSNFYKQNGYLEFDALMRLGISDYKNYVKRLFSNEQMTTLDSCIVSKRILDQVEADIDECISSKTYIDLQSNLPSVFNDDDISTILKTVLNIQRKKQVLIFDSFVVSIAFVDALSEPCAEIIDDKAKAVVESGRYQQYQMDLQLSNSKPVALDIKEESHVDLKADKREERRKKAAGGKAGGGAQGRETKTKSTKKQTKRLQQNDSDDETSAPVKKTVAALEIISQDDVEAIIRSPLEEEGLDELITSLAAHIQPSLNVKALEVAGNLYASTITNQTANRRQTHAALQDKLNTLLGDVRLFKNGIKLLPNDVQAQLNKYLLKSLCADITNEIINYLSSEYGLGNTEQTLTIEQRNRLINELPQEHRAVIQSLAKTLLGTNVDDFMAAAEESLAACSMILKKIDKKKDRQIILGHKHGLLEQLSKCDDPAMVLHLVTLIIFEVATQTMLHCSGRHVSAILAYLNQFLTEEQYSQLYKYHGKFGSSILIFFYRNMSFG